MADMAYLTSHTRGVWHLPNRPDNKPQETLHFKSLCDKELAGEYLGQCGWHHPRVYYSAALPVKAVEEAGFKFCSQCVAVKETGQPMNSIAHRNRVQQLKKVSA